MQLDFDTLISYCSFFTEKHFKRLSTKEKTFLKGDNLEGEDEAKAVKLRAHEKAVE